MSIALFTSHVTDRWATPRAIYEALDSEFHFNFDPCPLDGKDDGLAPLFYGPGIKEWIKRGGAAAIAVYLLPARTDVKWFHDLVLPHAKEVRFIRGRLRFGNAVNPAPFPSMVVVFEGALCP